MRPETPVPYHLTSIFTSRLILFFVLIFFCISLLTRQFELTVLTLAVLLVTGVSYVWSCFAFSRLSFEFYPDNDRLFVGETLQIRMSIVNNKFLPVWIKADKLFDPAVFDNCDTLEKTGFLLWHQKTDFIWHLKTLKRGCFNITHSQISAFDPLAFYPRQKSIRQSRTILVFPRLIPIRPLQLTEKHFFGSPGAKSPVQDPVYILGTRDCQDATPAKMIHWKASARLEKLQEKICEPSVQGKVLIIVDVDGFFENQAEQPLEKALETAASLADDFVKKDYAVGFLTNAGIMGTSENFIPLGRSRKTLSRILETIARMDNCASSGISSLFQFHSRLLWGVHSVILCYSSEHFPEQMPQMMAAKKIPTTLIVHKKTTTSPDHILAVPVENLESICI